MDLIVSPEMAQVRQLDYAVEARMLIPAGKE
jgi:hypothetical protein